MNIDFERIRKESLEEYMSQFKSDDSIIKLISQMAEISSKISKQMLIKYHEEINKSDN